MDRLSNSYIQKWLGLPRCFSDTGLFGAISLQLPIQSITLGCEQKCGLVLELRESADPLVRNADGPVLIGRKWQAHTEVNKAISRLQHQEIIGCKTPLTQGCYRGRHNQVMKKLAEVLETCKQATNNNQPTAKKHLIQFISPWSAAAKTALLIELTITWEKGMQAAHEHKMTKYSDLAAECREAGWTTIIYPVEVSCWGFFSTSTPGLLQNVGVTGVKLQRATKVLTKEAAFG
eukprot:superscaffoldBa00000109_g1586